MFMDCIFTTWERMETAAQRGESGRTDGMDMCGWTQHQVSFVVLLQEDLCAL